MDDKVFNLLEKMYADLTTKIDNLGTELQAVKGNVQDLKGEVTAINKQVTKIEVDHGNKLEALFDGYKQNTQLLKDIRDEVARHEEVIIKRVK